MTEENDRDRTGPEEGDGRRPQHIRRAAAPKEEQTVAVDSAAFFSAPSQPDAAPVRPAGMPTLPPQAELEMDEPGFFDPIHARKRGIFMVILQAALSIAALVQLYRTQMLPALYLIILGALLFLVWLLVWRCQKYKVRGILTRVLSLVLCAAMAVGCVFAQQGLQALSSVTAGLVSGQQAQAIVTEPFVIYLSGVDTRGELTEKARSDVNILAVVNPVTKRVALINTPRDYYVDLAGTDSKDKLTHAGLYGVESSMATLGNLYGVEVEHYIRINFAGFMTIVDALGGVDVYSDYTFTSVGSPGYYDPTDFVEGWNHLDGAAALAFARERHAFASGDIQRGINQMKVIDAMLNKIKSPALLTSYSRLMAAAEDCFVTSLSSDQIAALVRMQLKDFAEWDIQSYSVTGTNSSSTSCYSAKGQNLYVMKPDANSVNEAVALIQSVLGGDEASGEGAASKPASQPAHSAAGNAGAAVPAPDSAAAESVPEQPEAPSETPADSEVTEPEAGSEPEEAPAEPPAEAPAESPAEESTPVPAEPPAESTAPDPSAEEAAQSLANILLDAVAGVIEDMVDSAGQ